MSLHRDGEQNILEMLFNKKHKQGWLIMENACGILKKTFCKNKNSNFHYVWPTHLLLPTT
jgi:hypothetical protein